MIVALLVAGATASATDFDFSGNFNKDNDVALVSFIVAAPGNVTLFTSSWLHGGFDPVLSVWGADWGLVAFQDDANPSNDADSLWDAYLDVPLTAGDYAVSLTQANNYPVRPSFFDGFRHDADPDFTSGWGSQPYFNGVWQPLPDPRTSRWDLHILNVAHAQAVPEPSTWLLLGIGGLAIARLRRRF